MLLRRTPVISLVFAATALCAAACGSGDAPALEEEVTTETLSLELSVPDSLAAGGYHSCAIVGTGQVRCMGRNYHGQLGDGTNEDRHIPTLVHGIDDAVAITAGVYHTCALRSGGTVSCWGRNTYGQLGDGSITSSNVPVDVTGLTTAVTLSAGDDHTCVSLEATSVMCWGRNSNRQLGDGTTINRTEPVYVAYTWFWPFLLGSVQSVASGGYHTCALTSWGGVRCWGYNAQGQLGNGTTSSQASIVDVMLGNDVATSLSTGRRHTCVGLNVGEARCWGQNASGQLSHPGSTANQPTPQDVQRFWTWGLGGIPLYTAIENISQTDGGLGHSCFARTDGSAYCSGYNSYGQLGLGTIGAPHMDAKLLPIGGIDAISTGRYHTCVWRDIGTLECFGYNYYGQLGNESTQNSGDAQLAFVDILDGDGVDDRFDNCPEQANLDQLDSDGDGLGDACDDPPTWSNASLVASNIADTSMDLAWTAADHPVGVESYYLYRDGVEIGQFPSSQLTATVSGLTAGTYYTFKVEADDVLGSRSSSGPSLLVSTTGGDPTAPDIDDGGVATVGAASEFLYTGTDPVQEGVDPADIDPARAAVLRGSVVNRDTGMPLDGVIVTIKDHPEYGQTETQVDGTFAMVVNGGGVFVLEYEKLEYIPVQRRVSTYWNDYRWASDVAMIQAGPATSVNADYSVLQTAEGELESDVDGDRTTRVLFPAGTKATMIATDGTETEIFGGMSVRTTEFTVGDLGPAAMPGELQPGVAYTFAASFTIDEALAAGADRVEFDNPVFVYVDNFLGFPVGGIVPNGVYDRDTATWIPEPNGRVIQVVSDDGTAVTLDIDGDGFADSDLSEIGIVSGELEELSELYDVGDQLWRVPVTHFSEHDCNWGASPPDGAEAYAENGEEFDEDESDESCEENGSIIECENQALGESIGIAGSAMALHYQSLRARGRSTNRTLTIPLTDDEPPEQCIAVNVEIGVAGQRWTESFTCEPNQTMSFTWNGIDAWGRYLQGAQMATLKIGYRFTAMSYGEVESFGSRSTIPIIGSDRFSRTLILGTEYRIPIGGLTNTPETTIGGWTLSNHHRYDPVAGVLHYGDGTRHDVGTSYMRTQARTDLWTVNGSSGAMAFAPDGSVYVAGQNGISRIFPDGTEVPVVAGGSYGGTQTDCLDDGLAAITAPVGGIKRMHVGEDGTLYFATSGRIRKVTPDGIISSFIANGRDPNASCPQVDPDYTVTGFATNNGITDFAFGPGGYVYFFAGPSVLNGQTLYRMRPNGAVETSAPENCGYSLAVGPHGDVYMNCDTQIKVIRSWASEEELFAGNGTSGVSGDHGLAVDASLRSLSHRNIAVAPNGDVYFTDGQAGAEKWKVVRRVREGYVERFAGEVEIGCPGTGDGGTPLDATFCGIFDMDFRPDGVLAMLDSARVRIVEDRRIGDNIALPSKDGSVMYLFDNRYRHIQTVDSMDGTVLTTFTYDAAYGRYVETVTDIDGNIITIDRDASGRPETITGPDGETTSLAVNGLGYLQSASNENGESVDLVHSPDGLLGQLTDPKGYMHTYSYDGAGRLTLDDMPLGSKTLWREGTNSSFTAYHRTEELSTTQYSLKRIDAESTEDCEPDPDASCVKRTVTTPDGRIAVSYLGDDGSRRVELADGTVVGATTAGDPRFGLNSPFTETMYISVDGVPISTVTNARSVQLADPDDPLSVISQTDTTSIGGRTSTNTVGPADAAICGSAATQMAQHTSPEGRVVTSCLDDEGTLLRTAVPGVFPTDYQYDSSGRVRFATQGERTVESIYDPTSGLLTDAIAYIGVIDGTPTYEQTSFAYDAIGRLESVTFPDGNVESYSYDANGNRETLVRPGPGTVTHEFGFGALDLPLSYTPPPDSDGVADGSATTYDFDARMDLHTNPDGTTADPQYVFGTDLLDLVTLTRPSGNSVFDYRYQLPDSSNRVSSIVLTDSFGGVEEVAFAYQGPDVVATTWIGSVDGTVSYDRGLFHTTHQISEQVNGADTIVYSYDRDDLTTSANLGSHTMSLASDPDTGFLTGYTLGGVSSSSTPDGYAELASRVVSHGANPLLSVTYTRDALGRITSIAESIEGEPIVERGYRYHARGWLTEVRDGSNQVVASYDYDDNGNRLFAPNAASASYDDQDRLLDYDGTPYSYTYTANGEVASATGPSGTTFYEYDIGGPLRTVTLPDSTFIEYILDPLGHRIARYVDGTLEAGWLYNGSGRPVAQLDNTGAVVARFAYPTGGLAPDFMEQDGATYAFIKDHLGSVRLVVDVDSGTVMHRVDYDEFGQIVYEVPPPAKFVQPFGYAGGLYDPLAKLVHFGARDYDPMVGRWLSKDPAGFVDGANRYSYVDSDPINRVDPSGLAWYVPDWEDVSNFSAGFGDRLTFGLTRKARKFLGVDDVVDYCSAAYAIGGLAGEFVRDELLGIAIFTGLSKVAKLARLRKVKSCAINSFAAGTPVLTPDGHVSIEELDIGDLVLARDEQTGEVDWRPIADVISSQGKPVLELELETADGTRDIIAATANHPMWQADHGWVDAGDVEVGAQLLTADESTAVVVAVRSRAAPEAVYNFEVEELHTYFVGDSEAWVHNCGFTGPAKNAKWVRARQGRSGPGLRNHYAKHGGEVGARNARAYDHSARATIQNGRRFRYRDKATNAPRVGYFNPSTGLFTGTSQTRKVPAITTHFRESWSRIRGWPGFTLF